ncbi:MAG: 4Fe-4S dicluster domain-containing protein [Rhodopirellula sp.]|nr:4Fe-4S dicluster domain-containing protein [Rhodopirellula sp.]
MSTTETDASNAIDNLAHTRVEDCYQCGKCSAGCPMAEHMDLLPNQLIRLIQMDRLDKAVRSEAIWQCVSCLTCSTRCPKSVDCAAILDALRQMSIQRDCVSPRHRRTVLFQRAFLDNIRRNGRLRELELVGEFKMRGFFSDRSVALLLKDAMLGPKMLKRRKLHLWSRRVKDRGVVRRIFERCESPDGDYSSE